VGADLLAVGDGLVRQVRLEETCDGSGGVVESFDALQVSFVTTSCPSSIEMWAQCT
jgi:hypothetical protein